MTPADKLQSLLSMLAERGKLRPYNFPVVQLAMGNTTGAEPRRAALLQPEQVRAFPKGEYADEAGIGQKAAGQLPAQEVVSAEMPTAPTQLQREAEELYLEFRINEP